MRGLPRRGRLHVPIGPVRGTIVCVHGSGGGSAEGFDWLTRRLSDLGIASLVVDKVMDGYTGTRRDYRAFAADACDALRWVHDQVELRYAPFALLGYSEGSWVAIKAAARAPYLMDLVVLCSAPLTPPRHQTAYHRANLKPGLPRLVRLLRFGLVWG